MAAHIQTLYDSSETNIIYPQTKAEAVFTSNNDNVEQVLNEKLDIPTGSQGQILGFVDNNTIGAIDLPPSNSVYSSSYNGTLLSGENNWILNGNLYYQQIDLQGITSDKTLFVFPQWSTNISYEQISWNYIVEIESFDGYVRFYTYNPILVNVNFILIY